MQFGPNYCHKNLKKHHYLTSCDRSGQGSPTISIDQLFHYGPTMTNDINYSHLAKVSTSCLPSREGMVSMDPCHLHRDSDKNCPAITS